MQLTERQLNNGALALIAEWGETRCQQANALETQACLPLARALFFVQFCPKGEVSQEIQARCNHLVAISQANKACIIKELRPLVNTFHAWLKPRMELIINGGD